MGVWGEEIGEVLLTAALNGALMSFFAPKPDDVGAAFLVFFAFAFVAPSRESGARCTGIMVKADIS